MSASCRKRVADCLETFLGLSPAVARLVACELCPGESKSIGGKWNVRQKCLVLFLLKRSKECYFELNSIIKLPTKYQLMSMLNAVPLSPGINGDLFLHLAQIVCHMKETDKICALLFEDMSIREGLSYNHKKDCIVGYEDYGAKGKTCCLASSALVFMARGLKCKWKQPVAFYFCRKSLSSRQLMDLLLEVLSALQNIGLRVVAVVSKLTTRNRKTFRLLGSLPEQPTFKFNGQNIATVFDPTYLLTRTRDLFMKHPVRVEINVVGGRFNAVARWQDIVTLFEHDQENPFRQLPKLTPMHMKPRRPKTSITIAAQVFSYSVAAVMSSMVGKGVMDHDALATATLAKLLDDVFDSLNGSSAYPEGKKSLRSCLDVGSAHWEFWTVALEQLKSLVFYEGCNHEAFHPPEQQGWVSTITAVIHVYKSLVNAGVTYLEPRTLNLDPLRAIFQNIRLLASSGSNPNSTEFTACLKTVVINNENINMLDRVHFKESSEELLSKFQDYLEVNPDVMYKSISSRDCTSYEASKIKKLIHEDAKKTHSVACISTLIVSLLLRNIKCKICIQCLVTRSYLPDDSLIPMEQERDSWQLCYPSDDLVQAICLSITSLEELLSQIGQLNEIGENVGHILRGKIDFQWFCCIEHRETVVTHLIYLVCQITIPCYCAKMNQRLKEEEAES